MGIIYSNAALLMQAKLNNVCFDSILTIGHQTLYLSQKQIRQLANNNALKIDVSDFSQRQYANKFFEKFFAAKNVESLDYSDYQNCDIMHDMNHPVDQDLHEKFDVVIDGGSLEHIFNFPVAVANCMKMVKKGGSLFIFTMANNHSGHGFYQFSPELFFRIFQSENGFAICDVILEKHPFPGAELSSKTKCYSVIDPEFVKGRVGLVCNSPVMIMIHAIKTDIKPVFASYPIQSDYTSLYADHVPDAPVRRGTSSTLAVYLKKLVNLLPTQWKNFITGRRQLLRYSFSNKRFYKRWYPL